MRFLKAASLSLIILFLFCSSGNATHIIGGEITYKCFGDGNYEFTMKIYRDCSDPFPFDESALIQFYDSDGNIISSLQQGVPILDISKLDPISPDPCISIPPTACVEVGTYIFDLVLPPKAGGYTIAYQKCCRNLAVINIVSPAATGSIYFVTMNDFTLLSCNNSPVFKNYPPIVICNDRPLSFDHSATDDDGDSLVYELCQPYANPSPVNNEEQYSNPPFPHVTYKSGYSFSNPMKGNPALAIDSKTGLLTVTPSASGRFVVGICISEYRNGKLLGQYLRDFQFIVLNCTKTVDASFPSEINLCDSTTIHFKNTSKGGTVYHWDFGVAGINSDTSNLQFPAYTYPGPGVYNVTLRVYKTGTNCGDTATGTATIYDHLKAFSDTAIIFGTFAKIWATGGNNYHWTPCCNIADSLSQTTLVKPDVTTTYYVTGLLPNGCAETDSVVVVVLRDPVVQFSNAFSPNKDGHNDFFHPMYVGVPSLIMNITFRIYNRWGQLIYESHDINQINAEDKGWDGTFKGTPQPTGVYVYYFEGTGTDLGTPFNFKGNITLLR